MQTNDLRPADAWAVRTSVELVALVTPEDLGRPTPCAEWTLGDLLAHMTAQHRGFAAAARGRGADLAVWRPATTERRPATAQQGPATAEWGPATADPRTYAEAAEDVLAAFAAPDALERDFALPEFGPGATFPGSRAIGFHFIDYLVHGWDVARSLGLPFALKDAFADDAVRIAGAVPDGEARLRAGAAFRPSVPKPEHASALDQVLAALGRRPDWPARY